MTFHSLSQSRYAALALLIGARTAALADDYSRAEAHKYIRDAEAAWAESVSTEDASVVQRILADHVVWVLDGQVLDKAHAVADAAAGPGDFLSNHLDYVNVRFFEDTAVAQGAETWTCKGGRTGRFIWTDTWLRRAGKWQIVATQDTSVPVKSAGSP